MYDDDDSKAVLLESPLVTHTHTHRLHFGEHNVQAMFAVLQPLHTRMEMGAETLKEISFNHVRKIIKCRLHTYNLVNVGYQDSVSHLPFTRTKIYFGHKQIIQIQ